MEAYKESLAVLLEALSKANAKKGPHLCFLLTLHLSLGSGRLHMALRHLGTLSALYPHSTRRGEIGSGGRAIVGAAMQSEGLKRECWIIDSIDRSMSGIYKHSVEMTASLGLMRFRGRALHKALQALDTTPLLGIEYLIPTVTPNLPL